MLSILIKKLQSVLTYGNIKEFLTHDYFWRCFKVTFYTVFLAAYFTLYFDKSNLYTPFVDGNLFVYKLVCSIELFLSFCYLFLVIGGAFKYKHLSERHHKVWFWIFMILLFLWFTTVWFKFAIVWLLGKDAGLLYRSPLQNLVTQWFYGLSCHYEPGVYLVHKTWLLCPFDLQTIVNESGYVDNVKYCNILLEPEHKKMIIQYYAYDKNSLYLYAKALRKYTEGIRIITFIEEEKYLDKNFFYYWEL